MKLLYIITGLGLGGAEVITMNIACNMAERGHDVKVIYLTGENEVYHDDIPNLEVIGMNMKKTPFDLFRVVREIRKIIARFDPEVIHGNMIHANIVGRLARLGNKRICMISTEHNKDIEGRIRMLAYQWTDCLSDLNTNVSKEALDYFVEQGAFLSTKSRTFYNGIDLSKFKEQSVEGRKIRERYGILNDEFLFINVGRLMEQKDQKNLLHAFRIVANNSAHVKLLIVGKGEEENNLKQLIQYLGLEEKVILAGAHLDIERFYNAADCFVLSSAWEGFGLVIAEAMACGLPVIATDAGGCAEVVDNPNYVVPIKNSQLLAQKMMEVQNMEQEELNQLKQENIHKASRFDLRKICDEWELTYKQLHSH